MSMSKVFVYLDIMFKDSNPEKRTKIRDISKDIIDLAADFGIIVNIGRVRGRIWSQKQQEA